jgi:hypothetical protein
MKASVIKSETGLKRTLRLLASAQAASLAEFAIALPLLVVLVVGIFDFGGAFNMKQELNNAAREGARFGATQPTNDLTFPANNPAPPSVDAIRYVVDSYLQQAKINDCGLGLLPPPSPVGSAQQWIYSANGCGALSLQLTIQRDFPGPGNQGSGCYAGTQNLYVLCTQVIINYPYQWHFNSVIQLLIPGARIGLTNIQTQATAVNAD